MLNLGNITFGLGVNTSGLDQGARVLERFGARVDNAMQRSAKGFDYNTAALKRQEGAAVRALQQVQSMQAKIQNMRLDPQVRTENIDRLNQAYLNLAKTMATPINRTLDPLTMQRAQLGFKEQIDAVTRALATEQTAANNAAATVVSSMKRQELAALRAQERVASLTDQIARLQASGGISSKVAESLTSRVSTAGAGFSTQMASPLSDKGMLEAQIAFRSSLQGIQRDVRATTAAVNPLKASMGGFVDSLAIAAGPLNGMVYRMRASRDMMDQYGITIGLTTAAIGGLTAAVVGLGGQILDITIQYQKADQTLKGLLNSSAMATGELSYLRDVSNQAGLAFASLAPQFSRFVSAAQGSGQGLSETNEQFKQMALLSGTLHLTTDEVNRIMLAFDQMLSAGKIMGDDMRQLRNVLPAAYEAAGEAAERMGTQFKNAAGKINNLNPSEFISNLLDVYMEMFNIDMNKPIDTLLASLTRIKNNWQEFIYTLSTTIGASEKFQAIFDGISNGIADLGDNIDVVLNILGAFTGGVMGLVAAMTALWAIQRVVAVFQALNTLWAFGSTAMAAYTAATAAAGGALRVTTAAQIALNTAMVANPIGAVVKGVIMLTGVLWGAKMAYDAMNSSLIDTQTRMADTSGIDAYIASQKAKGKQVAAVTAQLRDQVRAHIELQAAESAKALNKLAEMQADRARLNQPFGGLQAFETGIQYGTINLDEMKSRLDADIRGQEILVNEYQQNVARLHGQGSALSALAKLPDDKGPGQARDYGDAGNKNGREADPDRGLRALNDIINRAQNAQRALDTMWQGPTHSGLLEALDDVQRRLFDMDADQLKRLGELFSAASVDVSGLGGIEDALAVVTLNAQQAEDAVEKFNKVWEDIQSGQQQLQNMQRTFDYLVNGGDPENSWIVEAVNRAKETVRSLTTQDLPTLRKTLESLKDSTGANLFNESAISAIMGGAEAGDTATLTAVTRALSSLGIEVASTGDAARDAEDGLAQFFSQLESGRDRTQRASAFFGQLAENIRGFKDSMDRMAVLANGGTLQQALNLDYLQSAREAVRYLDEDALAGLKTQLQAVGIAGSDPIQMLADFYKGQDLVTEASDRMTSALEMQAEAWASWSTSSIDSIRAVILEGESLKRSIVGILAELGNTILDAAIFDPMKEGLSNVVSDMVKGKEGVGLGDAAGVIGGGLKRLFGLGGSVTGGDRLAEVAPLESLTKAAGAAGDMIQGSFLSGLLQSVWGTQAETSAQSVNTSALIAATMALNGFTATLLTASAMNASNSFMSVAPDLIGLFANGGWVTGPGGPRGDQIPAMLSNEEFVMNAKAAQQNKGLLNYLNRGGQLKFFSDGGSVTVDDAVRLGSFGGPQMSGLTSKERPSKIDARSTFVIQGNVDQDVWEQMKAWAEARDAALREELPYLIDGRVVDSLQRDRF